MRVNVSLNVYSLSSDWFICTYYLNTNGLTLLTTVADDDGDTVRCRWATNTPYDECSGVCNTLNGSYLDEVMRFIYLQTLK